MAIYTPTKAGYYRLKWAEPDGRLNDTTAGTTLDKAQWKTAEIDAGVSQAAGSEAVQTLGAMFDKFIAVGHSHESTAEGPSHDQEHEAP